MQLSTITRHNFTGSEFFAAELRMKSAARALNRPQKSHPVAIITRRRIREGCHVEFEQVVQAFFVFADSFPGHVDIHTLSRLRGRRKDCVVVNRFVNASARQVFTSSRSYLIWLTQLQALTEEMPADDTSSRTRAWAQPSRRPKAEKLSFQIRVIKAIGFSVVLLMLWMLPLLPLGMLLGWQPFLRDVLLIAAVLSVTAALIVSFWDDRCMTDFPSEQPTRLTELAKDHRSVQLNR